MKKFILLFAALSIACIFMQGCDFIGDVFKAGIWVGIIIVIAIIALIAFVVSMFKK